MANTIDDIGNLVDLSALKARLGKNDNGLLNFTFQVGSVAYKAQVNADAAQPTLLILAEFGALPYSIEGGGRRKMVVDVLEYSKNFLRTERVRFGISKTQSLFLLCRATLSRPLDMRQILLVCCDLLAEAHVPVCLLRDHAPFSFLAFRPKK